jgi:hypothetical protein
MPRTIFRYVLETSGLHQLFLLLLTVGVFLLEVVPLELGAIPAIDAGEVSAAGTTTCAADAPVTSAAPATASQRRPIVRSGGSKPR